jgi:hypothetical protein
MGLSGLTTPREPPPDDVIGAKKKAPHVVLAALPQQRPELIAAADVLRLVQVSTLPNARAQLKPAWLLKGGFQGTSAARAISSGGDRYQGRQE